MTGLRERLGGAMQELIGTAGMLAQGKACEPEAG